MKIIFSPEPVLRIMKRNKTKEENIHYGKKGGRVSPPHTEKATKENVQKRTLLI